MQPQEVRAAAGATVVCMLCQCNSPFLPVCLRPSQALRCRPRCAAPSWQPLTSAWRRATHLRWVASLPAHGAWLPAAGALRTSQRTSQRGHAPALPALSPQRWPPQPRPPRCPTHRAAGPPAQAAMPMSWADLPSEQLVRVARAVIVIQRFWRRRKARQDTSLAVLDKFMRWAALGCAGWCWAALVLGGARLGCAGPWWPRPARGRLPASTPPAAEARR
jgi:hypothetical protein